MKKSNHNEIAYAVLAAIIALVIALISMNIWNTNINVPSDFGEDGMLGAMLVKSIKQEGILGFLRCSRLGAHGTSSLIDTPFLDVNYGILAWSLSRFFSPSATLYLMYIIGYPLIAITTYIMLSYVTNRKLLKVCMSVVFAIAPYHFSRGIHHLTLSMYYVIPIFVLLSLMAATENYDSIFPERVNRPLSRFLYIGACVLVGWSNIYYAFAALVCITVACIIKMIHERKISILWHEAGTIYLILLSIVSGLSPKFVYSIKNGPNIAAGIRLPLETELYGLKIIQLLLPCGNNRIPILSGLYHRYTDAALNINENQVSSLGTIATIGFLTACVWLIYHFVAQNGKLARNTREQCVSEWLSFSSLAILFIVLYATSGGFGMIVAYWITPELRALNRLSIVISCLSILTLTIVLDYAFSVISKVWGKRLFMVVACVLLLVSSYAEIPVNAEGNSNLQSKDAELQQYFGNVENMLPAGAMVYQLPFMQFPEVGPMNNIGSYEMGIGYYYTDTLRWSYGGMKGRNVEAESLYADEGMGDTFIIGIQEAGFSAVLIDTNGYSDSGSEIISYYSDILGLKPYVSDDGRFYMYNIENVTCASSSEWE